MATAQQMTVTLQMEDMEHNSSHIPRGNGYVLDQDVGQWLQELGEKYMSKVATVQPGSLVPGVKYRFDRLPTGYSLWVKNRSDGTRRDKYLYGHPRRRPFASQAQFVEHLFYHYNPTLPNTCPCKPCNDDVHTTAPSTATASAQTASSTATASAQTAPQTPTVNGLVNGIANLTTTTQPPTMSAASAPPPPPGAVVYGCALPPGSWGEMPPKAPHGPAWYDEGFEKRMAELKPELHIYDTHMPGKKCKWCPLVTMTDYCTCCSRFFYVRGADTTLPHYEKQ